MLLYLANVLRGLPIWKEAPFIRITIPFTCGILLQYYTNNPSWVAWFMLFIACVGWFWITTLSIVTRFMQYHWQGVLMNIAIIGAGSLVCYYKNPFHSLISTLPLIKKTDLYLVSLTSPSLERSSSWKAEGLLDLMQFHGKEHQPQTNVLVYFRKKETVSRPPPYGSRIAFAKPLQRIQNFRGLGSFDYVRYCALKNIHYQVFLSPGEYIVLPENRGNLLWSGIFGIQDWTVNLLQRYIKDEKACGLALALLIGYKNNLDRDIIQSYSNTGVVHVIAISGLHLGIIYGMLQFACRMFGNSKFKHFVSSLIVITGLWTFSLLAGASPSVLRSAVMFSFIVLGRTGDRSTSLINNLAASAFFLLCFDPFWIFDLGFQLSYSALLSIAIYARPLYHAFGELPRFGEFLWKMNSVTLAAQILTGPILIFQFNQFPNFFLLTNFIAIPTSTIILVGEIFLCLLSFSDFICELLGKGIVFSINLLNYIVKFVEQLPYASTTGLYISFLQFVMAYIVIALLSSWLMLCNRKHLLAALGCATLFFLVPILKIW